MLTYFELVLQESEAAEEEEDQEDKKNAQFWSSVRACSKSVENRSNASDL